MNKHEWCLFLPLGLALLLASSLVACAKPPVINQFTASPAVITAGESTTLAWSVTGATTVAIDEAIGNVALTGTTAVSPAITTRYTLTASKDGLSVTATTHVVVSGTSANGAENGEPPTGAISWDEARNYIGERITLCGPVVSATWATGSKGKPTFLNIGEPYPDPDRFTVIIWGDYRGNFSQPPEDYYVGKTICVTGLIVEYQGIAEIEVKTPDQIQEQ